MQKSEAASIVNVATTWDAATGGGQFNAIDLTGARVPIVAGGTTANNYISARLRACPLGSVISSADIRLNGGSTYSSLMLANAISQIMKSKNLKKKYQLMIYFIYLLYVPSFFYVK